MSSADAAESRAAWARSAQELVGSVVGGKYRIESILGRGGMGTIYRAEQQPLGRKVALKVLHSNLGDQDADPEFQKRFLLEAATLSQLSHPNIVVVHDYGSLDDDVAACFMAMELLEGKTINHVLAEEGPFTPARALRITRDIARALRAAHELGVIHRDLKPSNAMLCPSPEGEMVKVLDFGLVKVLRDDSEELTAEGRFLGSPRYMSPEQIQRFDMDGRSDLYSLGVILYRMLCAEVPFSGDHAVQTLMAHLQKPVPSIEERTGVLVPPQVEAIATRLLEKDPADRYENASALIAAIDALWPTLSSDPLPQSQELDVRRVLGEIPAPHVPPEHTPPSTSGVVPTIPHDGRATEPTPPPSVEEPDTVVSAEGPAHVESRRTSPAFYLVIAAAAVFALVASVSLVLLIRGPDGAPDARGGGAGAASLPDPAPPPEEPTAPPEPPPAAAPTTFALTITSAPEGAEVVRDGDVLGETPLTLELDAASLAPSPATFVLRAPGRRPYSFTQGPSEVDVTHEAALVRVPAARRGGRRGGTGSGGDMAIKTSR